MKTMFYYVAGCLSLGVFETFPTYFSKILKACKNFIWSRGWKDTVITAHVRFSLPDFKSFIENQRKGFRQAQ